MKAENIQDLVHQINETLGDFCRQFAYKRKELAGLGKAPTQNIFFKLNDDGRLWAINEGGQTEIQYHIFYHTENKREIGYGLGFNAQYVPFKNEKTPIDYIQPFADTYLEIKDSLLVNQLKNNGFHFIYGNEAELAKVKNDNYYLFGKVIGVEQDGSFADQDYQEMLANIKGPLYDLYCEIFKNKNLNDERRETISEDVALLKDNKNLILTGAPGTGKTYLAKQIARKLTGDNENAIEKERHWDFVQFHPSYDYTDFVEGLRPTTPDAKGNVGFKLTEGVFKQFCQKAVKASLENGQDNFEETWKKLVDELNEKGFLKVTNLSGTGEFEIELNEYGTGLASRTYVSESAKVEHNWEGYSKFFNKDQLYNVYRGLPGVPVGGHDNYRKAVINMMKRDWGLLEYKAGVPNSTAGQKYVFIIDEINRGDIAKIFGELFFALDPGYRGEKGRVKTQYTNLIDDDDDFKAGFYIPENVYIIGTMNDIDRNVESMDFAIRRRFTWKSISPTDTQEAILSKLPDEIKSEAIRRMNTLNAAIKNEPQLGEKFCLGAAYFKDLDDTDKKWDNLWEYRIQPLLEEYVRGLPNATELVIAFQNAYNLKVDNSSENHEA